jgi:CubicO group peptidase (beta-lactamase class C family)
MAAAALGRAPMELQVMKWLALTPMLALALAAAAHASSPPQRLDPARIVAVEPKIADNTFKDITSLLVVQDGRTVYEHYFNGNAADTLNDIRSASKSVTALLMGAAIDRGLVKGVDAKVYDFFPEYHEADVRKRAITVEDLMTMSSIWECDDENQFSTGNEERMYVSERWLTFALSLPVKGFAPWMKKPAESPYGRAFSYCTAGAFTAGAVVERAAHKPLSAFAAEVLEKPLGISHVQWNVSAEGIGMGGGGTRYTARDLAKLGQLALDDGRWQGRQVISAAFIHSMFTPHAQAREDAEYGYFWWRFHFKTAGHEYVTWAMSGNGGNYVFVVPELRLVTVLTSHAYNQRYAHPQSQKIFTDYVLSATAAAGPAAASSH